MVLSAFWEYSRTFDGHSSQRYFHAHPMLPISVVLAYLVMVRYGPRYMNSRPPFKLRAVSRIWNLSIAFFSIDARKIRG